MARYHQRWRVIQFLRRVPRHWTELIPRWKAGLHPGLSLLFLRFVAWIFLERGRAKSEAWVRKGERRRYPRGSSILPVFSQPLWQTPETMIWKFPFARITKKERKIPRSPFIVRLLHPPPHLFHYIICIFFFLRLSSCDIFFDRDVRTGLNSRGEFNRESSVIDEGRLHGTRSNNEFAARRMPAANRRSSECQGQNWKVSSIYLSGWMMLEQPRHWMALEYFYKICLNLEKPSSIVLSEVYSRNVLRRREYFEYLLQFSIIRNSFRFFFSKSKLRMIRFRKNEVLTSLKSTWFLLNSRHEYSYVLTSDLFARLNFTLNFNVNW